MKLILSYNTQRFESEILIDSYSKEEVYYNKLKQADNSLSCSIPYNLNIQNFINAYADNEIKAEVMEGSTFIFSGFLRKNFSFSKKQKNQPIKIEIVSPSFMLDKDLPVEVNLTNTTVGTIIETLLKTININTNIKAYLPDSVKFFTAEKGENIKEIINELLFENGFCYDFDTSGKFTVFPLFDIPETFDDPVFDNYLFNGENCLDEIKVSKKEEKENNCLAKWDNLQHFDNELIFADTTGGDASNFTCNIKIGGHKYLGDNEFFFVDYDSSKGKIKNVESASLIVESDNNQGLIKSFENLGNKGKLSIKNDTNREITITKLNINGSFYCISGTNKTSSTLGNKTKEVQIKYLDNEKAVKKFVENYSNYLRYSDYTISLKSKSNFNIGNFVKITENGLGTIFGRIIKKKTSLKSKVINYTIEALKEYEKGTSETVRENRGTNLNRGIDGVSLVAINKYYLTTNKKEGVSKEEVISTTPEPLSNEKKYLWECSENVFSDLSTSEKSNPILIGVYGDEGKQGIQGKQGPQGARGEQGLQGPSGKDGINGKDGAKGETGLQGPKGETGAKGKDGINGTNGKDGATGPQGPRGEKGLQGEKGEQGIQGKQGEKGNKGDKGENGKDGFNLIQANRTENLHRTYSEWTSWNGKETAFSWINNASSFKIGDTMVLNGWISDRADKQVSLYGTVKKIDVPNKTITIFGTSLIFGEKGEKGSKGDSIKGDKGEQGPSYKGAYPKKENVPSPKQDDYYLNTTEGKIYYYSSNQWMPDDSYSSWRYSMSMPDMVVLAGKINNDKVKSAVNLWTKSLVANTALINDLFANKITMPQDGIIMGGDRYDIDGDQISDKAGFYISPFYGLKGDVNPSDNASNIVLGEYPRGGSLETWKPDVFSDCILIGNMLIKENSRAIGSIYIGQGSGFAQSDWNKDPKKMYGEYNIGIGYCAGRQAGNNNIHIGVYSTGNGIPKSIICNSTAIGSNSFAVKDYSIAIGADTTSIRSIMDHSSNGTFSEKNSAPSINIGNRLFYSNDWDEQPYQKGSLFMLYNNKMSIILHSAIAYNKTEVNNLINNTASNYYTKTEADNNYYKKANTYTKTEADNNYYKKTEVNNLLDENVPVGSVMANASNYAPSGWLYCDGSAVSRSFYPRLFKAIGTRYGSGDGSTTFNLPNFIERFLAGASGAWPYGSYLSAGLPDIEGRFWNVRSHYDGRMTWVSGGQNGCFYDSYDSGRGNSLNTDNADQNYNTILFKASGSNSIYGASSTVRPPMLSMYFYIKY